MQNLAVQSAEPTGGAPEVLANEVRKDFMLRIAVANAAIRLAALSDGVSANDWVEYLMAEAEVELSAKVGQA